MNSIRELKQQEKYNNMLKRKNKEIERLNNELKLYKDNHEHLNNLLQQKDNIIKEVREYINIFDFEYLDSVYESNARLVLENILEILDKENKE